MTAPARFKQSDLQRALRAVKAEGYTDVVVDFPPGGGFRLLTGKEAAETTLSPLEQWEREHGDRAA